MDSYTLEIFMYIHIYTCTYTYIYVCFFMGSIEVVFVLLWM